MKIVLIFLGSLAVILGIFAYFAVFGPPTGSYAVSPIGNASSDATNAAPFVFASSTIASGTTATGSDTSSSSSGSAGDGSFASVFSTPTLSWHEGNAKLSITGVSLDNAQMTFALSIQTGAAPECVPLNLRLIADEEGDLTPPNPSSFTFSDSGNCNGAPNETYPDQTAIFTVDPARFPLLFTTGGSSNIFFEVVTSTNSNLSVIFPGTSG
jgi:hypothetical protein